MWHNILCPCKFSNKSVSLGAYPSIKLMIKKMPAIIDRFHYCQTSTEFLRKLCTTEWNFSYKNTNYYLHPNTVFAKQIQLNMLYLTWWNPSVPIWIKDFFLVGYSSTLRKLLTRWTIKYYLLNLIITAFEELTISGFPHI